MKHSNKLGAILLLFAFAQVSAQIPAEKPAPEDEAAVRKILEKYVEAWLKNDEKGVLSLFEDRGRIQPSGVCPYDSIHNIKKFWFPDDGSTTTIHQFDIEVKDINSMGKNLIFSSLLNRLYWSYKQGDFEMGKLQYGYANTVFRRQPDGSWKIWRQAWTDIKSAATRPVLPEKMPLETAFQIEETDIIPEGIAFDNTLGDLYLGSTWKRKILKISKNGQITEFTKSGQDGLLGVIGIRIDSERRLLWAATSTAGENMPIQGLDAVKNGKSGIFKYDLQTGKCLQKFWLDEAGKSYFLNDLTIDKNGRIYASETIGGAIYTIAPQSKNMELFLQLPPENAPNGLDLDDSGKVLFVSLYTKPRTFGRIDIATKKLVYLNPLPDESVGADGLYFFKNSLIAVQPYVNDRVITQYFLDEKMESISRIKVLLPDDPALIQPSTGAIAGNKFYYIATSQMQKFAKLWRENGGNVGPEMLSPLKIGILNL